MTRIPLLVVLLHVRNSNPRANPTSESWIPTLVNSTPALPLLHGQGRYTGMMILGLTVHLTRLAGEL